MSRYFFLYVSEEGTRREVLGHDSSVRSVCVNVTVVSGRVEDKCQISEIYISAKS
jgi:hypothetical protein